MTISKTVLFTVALAFVTACNSNGSRYDAEGSFESEEITLSAEANGRILQLDVREGQAVEKGDRLGCIDSVQLCLARMQLIRSETSVSSNRPDVKSQMAVLQEQLCSYEKERQRLASLYEDKAATAQQLDDINSRISVLKAQIAAQNSALVNSTLSIDAQSSSLEMQIAQLDDQIAKCRISAPVSGTVIAKYLHEGEFAAVGRPVLKIADLQHVFLRAYVTSSQLSAIQLGQKVKVFADFGGDNVREYEGTIEWISDKSEFTPKSIQTSDERENLVYAIKVAIRNDGFIKLGMYGGIRY